MKIEFSNEWYRATCKENGFDPDNILSQSSVAIAKKCAVSMQKYMRTQRKHKDDELHSKLQKEIDRLNNERIEHMLNALEYAQLMAGEGQGYNEFIKKIVGEDR